MKRASYISLRKSGYRKSYGFTIVELLIVVVVIAILAAITIVAYNGVTNNARKSAMKNTLQQVAKKVETYKVDNSTYPASLSLINNGAGPQAADDIRFGYSLSGNDYLLTIASTQAADRFRISNTLSGIEDGFWPGHDAQIAGGFPQRTGTRNITTAYGSGDTMLADISAIPDGSWMIVIFGYNNAEGSVPPAGWTSLVAKKTTNTLQTSIYARIKQPGDAAAQQFEAPGVSGQAEMNGALLWGTNAAAVGSWVVGGFGDRSVNATSTTAVTPTVTVATARSLVLSIAVERTSATEANYTSLTGATPLLWVPQDGATKMHTIAIGYNEQQNAGTSQAMTVTYPNAQTLNATAVQIAIPPAS